MYGNHVPTICAAMRDNPDTFARGVTFVVLTIRQMITVVPDQMAEVDAEGDYARALFGHKRDAYRYLQAHKCELWRDMLAARDTAEAIQVMCRVPGLAIVKSAFVCQLMGFDVACLDSRNIDREGRDPEAYNLHGKKTGARFVAKVAEYVNETAGRARNLWNAWCEDAAEVYGRTAEAISAIHLDCIVPPAIRATVAPMCVPMLGTPDTSNIPFGLN
jgi:hypothetical protein